jgi:hypothetical protein
VLHLFSAVAATYAGWLARSVVPAVLFTWGVGTVYLLLGAFGWFTDGLFKHAGGDPRRYRGQRVPSGTRCASAPAADLLTGAVVPCVAAISVPSGASPTRSAAFSSLLFGALVAGFGWRQAHPRGPSTTPPCPA